MTKRKLSDESSPPQAVEFERQLLGALILDPKQVDEIGSAIQPDDFGWELHRTIFRAILTLHRRSALDVGLIHAELQDSTLYQEAGGLAFLTECIDEAGIAAHAPHYAREVVEAAQLRALYDTASETIRQCTEPKADPKTILERVERALSAIGSDRNSDGPKPASDVALRVLRRIDEIYTSADSAGVLTGIADFDEEMGGLHPGELVILAARPSMGKTALAGQWSDHAARQGKGAVYFASLEMSDEELATRSICGLAGVNGHALRSGRIDSQDAHALAKAANEYGSANIWFDARPSMTVYDIRRAARKVARSGLRLVVVDYLQLVRPVGHYENRVEQIRELSGELKALARELNVPVLVLSQLNRESEKQDRPGLYHLRDGGSIEQDADVVIFLSLVKPNDRNGSRLLEVAKNRNGAIGSFTLAWIPEQTRFESLPPTGPDSRASRCSNYDSSLSNWTGGN